MKTSATRRKSLNRKRMVARCTSRPLSLCLPNRYGNQYRSENLPKDFRLEALVDLLSYSCRFLKHFLLVPSSSLRRSKLNLLHQSLRSCEAYDPYGRIGSRSGSGATSLPKHMCRPPSPEAARRPGDPTRGCRPRRHVETSQDALRGRLTRGDRRQIRLHVGTDAPPRERFD